MLEVSIYKILVFFVFLVLSGLFSSTETAFTAINRIRLKGQFEKENPSKPKMLSDFEEPSKLITAILIGNNFCNVACSALATTIIIDIFRQLNITNLAIVMPTITVLVTILLLIFGEITPKNLALKEPERLAVFSSKFISPLLIILYPVIMIFDAFNQLVNKIFKTKSEFSNKSLSIDELKLMVDISHDDGIIESEKNKMLTSIFEFSDIIVREIMTPRTDAICISDKESVQSAIQLIINEGHSRIPVYEDKMDNIIGIIYAKDLLNVSTSEGSPNVRKFMRTAVFIPEYKAVDDLFQQMKKSKLHMAIVVDEHVALVL